MASMTSFVCFDRSGNNLILECGMTTWTNYVPSLSINIKQKGNTKGLAFAYLQVHMMPNLINNVTNPATNGLVQASGNNNGATSFGRMGNDFIVQAPQGSYTIGMDDNQWANFAQYLTYMYNYAPVIKEVGICVRMHMMNLLRQAGLDGRDASGRSALTPWYMEDKNFNNQGGGGYNNNNFQNQHQQMPPQQQNTGMGMVGGSMPPPPTMNTNQQQMPPMAPPMGAPMPNMGAPMAPMPNQQTPTMPQAPTGATGNLADGIQNMLNGAFTIPPMPSSNG